MRPCRRSLQLRLSLALGVCLVTQDCVCADEWILTSGGRIRGTWVNRDRGSRDPYQIQLNPSVRLELAADQVEQRIRQSATEVEYDRLSPTFPDTLNGHWKLAQWCQAHRLSHQRRLHLERVLEFDADHAGAREGLGYRQIHGQWQTVKEFREGQGYQRYRGRWRLAQEIELIESREAAEAVEKDWRRKLKQWRAELETERAPAARDSLLAIRDPAAVKPLSQLLKDEPVRAIRLLYLATLAEIGGETAFATLVAVTLNDFDDRVFQEALDYVVRTPPPDATKVYARALKDPNPVRVNRAAKALGRLNDPSAVPALIDALVTTHVRVLNDGKSPDTISTTFVSAGEGSSPASDPAGTSFSTGSRTQTVRWTASNHEVLEALIRLSGGMNFGFNKQAWTQWLAAANKRHYQLEPRRE